MESARPVFSANLGFLFSEVPLLEAVDAAGAAGFGAVEFHWPFGVPAARLGERCRDAGLEMVGLNTWPGDRSAGDFGLCAVPGREVEAREATARALDYAAACGCPQVHLMAGKASGPDAESVFLGHLEWACDRAAASGVGLLIEPINPIDVPGYFLADVDQAIGLIQRVGAPGLALMFDCYHVARIHGSVVDVFARARPLVGHVQFASVPDRAEPDHGEVDYRVLLPELQAMGYGGPFGAEYRPRGTTSDGLAWLHAW